eukprot:10673247-Prorocentrum_lima.AAC.1
MTSSLVGSEMCIRDRLLDSSRFLESKKKIEFIVVPDPLEVTQIKSYIGKELGKVVYFAVVIDDVCTP